MSILSRLFGSAARSESPAAAGRKQEGSVPAADRGFMVFEQTGEVLAAERVLKKNGFAVEVKAPPEKLRRGCDMVLVCSIVSHARISSLLQAEHIVPLDYVPVSDPLLEPVSFFQTTDLGDWIMVRAANMKVTFNKKDGLIVNISGGGCPDVPCLAGLLTGRRLDEAEPPVLHGRTLCSYALQRAFEEAKRIWRG